MSVGPLSNTTIQGLFKEKYRDVVPALFETEQNFCSMIEKRDVEKIGPRGLIIAKKLKPGGQVRTFNPDGGDMGRGTGPQYDKGYVTPIPLLVALESTRAAQWNTSSNDIAIKNAVQDLLKDGTSEYKAQLDRYYFGDGTGVMATVASGGTGTTPVMTTPIGTRWLRVGHKYEVYNSGLTTKLGTATIDILDHPNKTATLTAAVAGMSASGDKLLPEGVTGSAPGWFWGVAYHSSSASTGLWMNMSRSSYPQIRSIEVGASSGALVPTHFRVLRNRLHLFRDDAMKKGNWMIVWNPAQRHAYEELALAVNVIQKQPTQRSGVEMLYNPDQFEVDGIKTFSAPNQNPTRIDLLNLENFFRVETVPFGLYTVDDVSTFPIYGASGGLATSEVTYLASISQLCCDDPGLNAYISSLAIPTGYTEFTT